MKKDDHFQEAEINELDSDDSYTEEEKKITLLCDEKHFSISLSVAKSMETLRTMIEVADDTNDVVPITQIKKEILKYCIEWCEYHVEHGTEYTEFWRTNFFRKKTKAAVWQLLYAADYLYIEFLRERCCKEIAHMISITENVQSVFTIQENDCEMVDHDTNIVLRNTYISKSYEKKEPFKETRMKCLKKQCANFAMFVGFILVLSYLISTSANLPASLILCILIIIFFVLSITLIHVCMQSRRGIGYV